MAGRVVLGFHKPEAEPEGVEEEEELEEPAGGGNWGTSIYFNTSHIARQCIAALLHGMAALLHCMEAFALLSWCSATQPCPISDALAAT